MAYSQKDKDQIINTICKQLCTGRSLRNIIENDKGLISMPVFYEWLDANELFAKQYARACNIRQEILFEEILEISDDSSKDHTPFTGGVVVQRDKLRADSRKWILSKMNPKKYGDKTDITTNGNELQSGPAQIVVVNSVPDMKELE
jgi:hypothetical protein